ncbi:hypothetical protein EVAR_86951_1 [Eumeta japonica]|uniref:Uncharacterized protein n=1 Tax=Eumeta variegata TaxID=151549 RepID=A0A4C1W5T3_EUMVA|nr:hypothetical protein EVAR_86951_1 [Eumeta japonica]
MLCHWRIAPRRLQPPPGRPRATLPRYTEGPCLSRDGNVARRVARRGPLAADCRFHLGRGKTTENRPLKVYLFSIRNVFPLRQKPVTSSDVPVYRVTVKQQKPIEKGLIVVFLAKRRLINVVVGKASGLPPLPRASTPGISFTSARSEWKSSSDREFLVPGDQPGPLTFSVGGQPGFETRTRDGVGYRPGTGGDGSRAGLGRSAATITGANTSNVTFILVWLDELRVHLVDSIARQGESHLCGRRVVTVTWGSRAAIE